MAQQTAVEWLKDMLEWNYGDAKMLEISWENLDDLLERAKQMEKEQMIEFALHLHEVDCSKTGTHVLIYEAKQYYNETYGK